MLFRSTTSVHHLKEVIVLLASEPTQTSNFKVGPEMTHVVFLAFHSLGVDIREGVATRFILQDVLGQGRNLIHRRLRGGFLWLDEHFPETLRSDVVEAFVGRGVAENVGDSLAKFLDSNSETVRLVGLDHLEEGVAGPCQSTDEMEWIVEYSLSNVTEVGNLRLNTPVPFVLQQQGVVVEEAMPG